MARIRSLIALCLFLISVAAGSAQEAEKNSDKPAAIRVLPEGKRPADSRLGKPRDLNSYFPFTPPKTAEEWKQRAEEVRRHILVANGLWPMPERTPLNPVIHGKVERDGFTVERVFFESYPGHFVTGSLFRPTGRKADEKMPGVLCPYGHWANGRFYQQSVKDVREAISKGAERFEEGGRFPLQARCMQLARMGCVVLHYDMISVADSQQLPNVAHHPPARPQLDTRENWGFYSKQAELRLQSIMGLQTWNSVRALDFLCGLPDVDTTRIGVTGASGGGTQTFILGAIDDRPTVAVPAVMVSTGMQGGCTCENCSLLRIGTGNVEFAAMFAPKPMCLIGADDWTVEIATKGGPELKQLYSLLGAKNNLLISPHNQFGHNYNYVSREVMYQWMNKHLKLGLDSPVIEEDFKPLSIEELTVWDEKHPKPPAGDDYERSLVKHMTEDSQRQLDRLIPTDKKSLAEFRRVVGGAWEEMIGRKLPSDDEIEFKEIERAPREGYDEVKCLLRNKSHDEELPTILLKPKGKNAGVVIWLDPAGKAGLFTDDGKPRDAVQQLLKRGVLVAGVDLLHQGELVREKAKSEKTPVRRSREQQRIAAFTTGYNPSVFAARVHDVLTVVAYCDNAPKGHGCAVIGLNGAGHWAAAAKMIAGDAIHRVIIDTDAFRFTEAAGFDDPDFQPGAAKYFDLPGVLALCAPGEVWVRDAESKPTRLNDSKVTTAAYDAAGAADKIVRFSGQKDEAEAAAVKWLLESK